MAGIGEGGGRTKPAEGNVGERRGTDGNTDTRDWGCVRDANYQSGGAHWPYVTTDLSFVFDVSVLIKNHDA